MKFYDNPGKLNIEGYRKAKNKALTRKLGIYIKVDGTNNIAIYLLSSKLDTLKYALSLIAVPYYIIRTDKKKKYGYNYARLIGSYSIRWQKFMETSQVWRLM